MFGFAVLTTCRAAELRLTSPADFQVFQRASAERGPVRVAG